MYRELESTGDLGDLKTVEEKNHSKLGGYLLCSSKTDSPNQDGVGLAQHKCIAPKSTTKSLEVNPFIYSQLIASELPRLFSLEEVVGLPLKQWGRGRS